MYVSAKMRYQPSDTGSHRQAITTMDELRQDAICNLDADTHLAPDEGVIDRHPIRRMTGEDASNGVPEVLADTGWMIQPPVFPEAGKPRGLVDGEGIQTPRVVLSRLFEGVELFSQGTHLPSH